MTNRDIVVPQSALRHALSDSARRIDTLRRRTTWPGAVQEVDVPGAVSLSTAWTTVAKLRLDPGRWFVMAGSLLSQDLAYGSYYVAEFQMLLNGEAMPAKAAASQTFVDSPGTSWQIDSGHISTTVDIDTEATLSFQTHASAASSSYARAYQSYIVAVPT